MATLKGCDYKGCAPPMVRNMVFTLSQCLKLTDFSILHIELTHTSFGKS
jgi:hypothetical protein